MKSLYCVNDPVNFADFDGLSLKELWNKAKNVVTKTVDAVKNVAKKTVSAVKSVVTNVAGKVSTAAKAVTQTVKTVVNTAKTVAGIARTDGLKNALSGLPTSAKATAWQGKVIQAAAKAAIQADNARTAQELAETKAEARQIVADWAGGVYEEFSPRNQKIIDDTVEKVRELLANGASPAEIKRVIRGACTEVAKNVGETVVEGVKEGVAQLTQLGTYNTELDAAIAFGKQALPLTDADGLERAAGIVKVAVLTHKDGQLEVASRYRLSKVEVGFHNNVIPSAVSMAVISELFDLSVSVVHSHPNCTCHTGNIFSGRRDSQGNIVEMGDIQVPGMGKINSIFAITPDGDILKYSGIGPAYINTGKDLDNDGYHDLVPVAGQDVGDVIDENGNKMQMTTIWDSVIGGLIPYK